MEIWAAIDLMGGRVVRLTKGDPETAKVYSDSPVQFAMRWENEGADGLHIIDLDATLGFGNNLPFVGEVLRSVKIPVQLGGGIRSTARAGKLLGEGVFRVILGTLAFTHEAGVRQIIGTYGDDRVMVALDYSLGKVMVKGWTEATDITVVHALSSFKKLGVKNFLLTSVERDGAMEGPDLETLWLAAKISKVKIFASGGIRSVEDLKQLKKNGASGVIVGKALYESAISLSEAVKSVKESK